MSSTPSRWKEGGGGIQTKTMKAEETQKRASLGEFLLPLRYFCWILITSFSRWTKYFAFRFVRAV